MEYEKVCFPYLRLYCATSPIVQAILHVRSNFKKPQSKFDHRLSKHTVTNAVFTMTIIAVSYKEIEITLIYNYFISFDLNHKNLVHP